MKQLQLGTGWKKEFIIGITKEENKKCDFFFLRNMMETEGFNMEYF